LFQRVTKLVVSVKKLSENHRRRPVTKINIILLMLMMAGTGCQHTRNGGVPTEAQLRKQEAVALKVSQRAFKQILNALNAYKSKMHPNDLKNSRDIVKVVNENMKVWEQKVIEGKPTLGIDRVIDKNITLLAEILSKQKD
jgi:hypothetical protein